MLGKIEGLVLHSVSLCLGDGLVAKRKEVMERVLAALCVANDGPPHKTAASFAASVSRAIHSLINKGFVKGYYRAWYSFEGLNNSGDFVGIGRQPLADRKTTKGKFFEPTLTYFSLTDAGYDALNSQEFND